MEIERKWLVSPERIPYDLSSLQSYHIEQAYCSFSPTIRVRSVDHGRRCLLTIKRSTQFNGIASEEAEMEIDRKTASFLFSNSSGCVISKTRYLHPLPSGLVEEIDIFWGDLQGLAYLEIEFPDLHSAQDYPSPDWVSADVTYDARYKNSALAQYGLPSVTAPVQ